jgi:hypothetical protein
MEEPHPEHHFELPFGAGRAHCPGWGVGEQPLRQREGDQPLPIPNEYASAHDLAIKLLQARKDLGLKRYGSLLQPRNGRDNLRDAIEEATDLLVYLVNEGEERRLYEQEIETLERKLGEAYTTMGRLRRQLRDAGLDEDAYAERER